MYKGRRRALLTCIVGLIGTGEPSKSSRCASTKAHDIDQGAVDVELLKAGMLRGIKVLDSHQVPSRRRSLWDGTVELAPQKPLVLHRLH